MRTSTTARIIAAIGVGTLALGFGAALPAQGALTTYCEGVAADVTVPNDLVVAKDQSCDLTNVTIKGDVTVRAGASLLTDGVSVSGKLTASQDAYADLVAASVAGDVVLAKAYGAYVDNSTVGGDTISRRAGFLYSEGSEHQGALRSNMGTTYLNSAVVGGPVVTSGDVVSDLDDTWVKGNLTVRKAELGSLICSSEVDGNTVLTGNGGSLWVGLDAAGEDCGSAYFGGALSVKENTADTVISNAIVRGNLNCLDNDPAPVGENNRVRGKALNQCEDLPAPGSATTQTFDATATEKVETTERQTAEKIESRRAAAQELAVQLGTADIG
ncbi:MAG: hypothetical protein ACTH2Q_07630 [Propionibacteriaceae bacterium]